MAGPCEATALLNGHSPRTSLLISDLSTMSLQTRVHLNVCRRRCGSPAISNAVPLYKQPGQARTALRCSIDFRTSGKTLGLTDDPVSRC